jgi:hypothetical protein
VSRCVREDFPNGGYCVVCEEQPGIPYVPEHVETIIDLGWNSGANSIEWGATPIRLEWKVASGPGGVFMGLYNSVIERAVINPSSLDLAIYTYASDAGTLCRAYVGGSPVGSPHGVSSSNLYAIEWVNDRVQFTVDGFLLAEVTVPSTVVRFGACLYQSLDEINSVAMTPLDAPPEGGGSNRAVFRQQGSSFASYGHTTLTFTQRASAHDAGRTHVTFRQAGSYGANFGSNRLTFAQAGTGNITQPLPSYGHTRVFFSQTGNIRIPLRADGFNTARFTQAGSSFANFGSNRATFFQLGSTNPPLTDYIIGLQSAGVTQLTFGFERYTLEDGINFNDGIFSKMSMLLRETLLLADGLGTQGSLHVMLRDGLSLSDGFAFRFLAMLADTIEFSEATRINMALRMLDTLVLDGTLTSHLDARALLATTLTFSDVLLKYFPVNLEDEVSLTESLRSLWSGKLALIDQLELADTLGIQAFLTMTMSETLELGDSLASQLTAIFRMSDEIGFGLRVRIGGSSQVFYAWAVNTESKSASRYVGMNFNSAAQVGRRLFLGSDRGLFAHEGNDDDGSPINARIRTGVESLGSSFLKRMVKAYLMLMSDGNVLVRFHYTSPAGQKTTQTFRVNKIIADDFVNTNVDIAKGMKSVYWSFEIANEDGADMTIDALKVIPLICENRANG